MVTENVNIAFQATGIPVIVRQIDSLGHAADRASRGFFLLQRALFTLGGFGLTRILTGSLDALTNMENRLRLTTESSWELEKVQRELFEIAKRTRTSWEGVSEIYNRAALSAKNLGIAQNDVLIFTEGVAKAAAISGAGTQEARAALIQLGQAVASNRLGGDELRSILEQLPFAADVIAKYMTATGRYGEVTRGNIRQLGAEGKITAKVIVEAFKSTEGELANLFENMPTTIGQALEIARTEFMIFLDEFDESTGFSDKLAKSILVIGQNIDLIAKAAAALAGVFGVALFGRVARSLGEFTNGIRANIVQQTSLRQRLISIREATVSKTQAIVAENAANRAQYAQNLALIAQKKILLQQEIQEAQFGVRNGTARNLQTGHYVSLTAAKANLVALGGRLQALESLEAAEAARLATARAAQAGATNTYAATLTRLQAAQAGATLGGRALAAANTAVTASMGFLKNAASGLFAFIGGWPGILLAAGAAILGLAATSESAAQRFDRLSQNTSASETAITELTDVQTKLNEAIAAAGPASDLSHNTIIANTQEELRAKLALLELERDGLVRLQEERQVALNSINEQMMVAQEQIANARKAIEDLGNLPLNGNIAANIGDLEKVIADLEGEVSVLKDQAKRLGAEFSLTNGQIERMTSSISSAYSDILVKAGGLLDRSTSFAAKLLQAYQNGSLFSGLNMEGAITPAESAAQRLINKLLAGINLIRQAIGLGAAGVPEGAGNPNPELEGIRSKERPNDIDFGIPDVGAGAGGGGGGGGGPSTTFADELADLQKRIDLEKQYGIQKEANNTILGIEEKLKRSLNATEKEQILNATNLIEISKIQGEILEGINAPQEKLVAGQQALNELLAQGAISMEIYTAKLREMQIAADQASMTLQGSFKAAIASSIMSASDLGKALGDWVVGAANSAADAIVNFAQTGEFNVRQFFNQLFAQLLKLAAQQILLKLLGGVFGGGVGGLFGFSGGGSILPGFATGGSILPNGPGSTDSQIVAFKKRPDERVDILTPAQQEAQRKGFSSGGQATKVDVSQKIVNVFDPSIVGEYLSTADGETLLINIMNRSGILNR
jgi:tape measure domain-containing protein